MLATSIVCCVKASMLDQSNNAFCTGMRPCHHDACHMAVLFSDKLCHPLVPPRARPLLQSQEHSMVGLFLVCCSTHDIDSNVAALVSSKPCTAWQVTHNAGQVQDRSNIIVCCLQNFEGRYNHVTHGLRLGFFQMHRLVVHSLAGYWRQPLQLSYFIVYCCIIYCPENCRFS
jgi:hypothetical protein